MGSPEPKIEYDACPRCGRRMVIGSALCDACEAKAARSSEGEESETSPAVTWLKIAGVLLAAMLMTGCVLGVIFTLLGGL